MRVPWTVEPRLQHSRLSQFLAPLLALAFTVVVALVLFAAVGNSPFAAIYYLFVAPFTRWSNVGEILLKMSPLLLIAQGLAIGFRARVWNIGAEGQLTVGAIGASLLPIFFNDSSSALMLPAMIVAGALCGMAWAGIAAGLRTRFNANEILVTLMLNNIALQLLYYLVSGPLRDPQGFNFPQSAMFPPAAMFPLLFPGWRANASLFIGLAATVLAWVFVKRSLQGFKLEVGGIAPDAASYAGFSRKRAIWISLLAGGCAAGLAGVGEVAGPLGQLQRSLSPGYGYAAIIVAFLGGLDPLGILAASFLLALIYVGGDIAQTAAGISYALNTVLEAVLLVAYLGSRLFVDYRVRLTLRPAAAETPA